MWDQKIFGQRLQETKNWTKTTEKTTGIKKIFKIDLSSKSYIFIEEKPLVSNFGETEYEG